jgi:hypothetical protein
MNTTRSTADYIKILDDLSSSSSFPRIGLLPEAIPINITETVEYHKNCLNVFLRQLHRSPKGVHGVFIIPVDILKERFIKRYDAASDKKATLWDELKDFHIQTAKVNEKEYRLSKFLYEKIKLGQQEKIFEIPYNSTSYLKFWRYARLWDLIQYKVYLDQLLDRDYKTLYRQLQFDLKPSQINELYKKLKGIYIEEDTNLSDFIDVLNIYNGKIITKIKWVHMAQNKLQVNKIGLLHLITKLQSSLITEPKRYVGEMYEFIVERFCYDEAEPFSLNSQHAAQNYVKKITKAFDKKNLARCKSDAEHGKTLTVKTVQRDIENIINDLRKV